MQPLNEAGLNCDAPGKVLLERYLKPKGISVRRFSALSGIWVNTIAEVLNGAFMSHQVIHRVSMATRTAPRYWYYLQAAYEFSKYLRLRKDAPTIEPIRFEIQSHLFESPGQVLEREFIKPTGKSYHAIAKVLHVHSMTLPDIVNGKRRITPLMAHKLARAFDTETKYWLDLQSCYEIQQLIEKNPVSEKRIRKSLSIFSGYAAPRRHRFRDRNFSLHPGKIIKQKFIRPSGIGIMDWQKILYIPAREFKQITSGKKEISPENLLKLSRVFNRDIGYWIERHNGYYALKADTRYSRISKQVERVEGQVLFQNSTRNITPMKFLAEKFLKPMQISQLQFFRHTKMDQKSYGNMRLGFQRISHEAAIRIGQALDMNPMYWISLQLEFDIEKYERGEKSSRFHRAQ